MQSFHWVSGQAPDVQEKIQAMMDVSKVGVMFELMFVCQLLVFFVFYFL